MKKKIVIYIYIYDEFDRFKHLDLIQIVNSWTNKKYL